VRLTFDPTPEAWPTFSPDGQRIVFSASRNGVRGLYQKLTTGTEEALILAGSDVVNPDWSSDGRYILYQRFVSGSGTGWDLWAVPVFGDRTSFPVAQTEHGEREGRLSPDVRWVAYDSTESGRREIWVQPFPPSGSRWQISTGGGVSPRWRGDGKELFYVAADGKLTAVPVTAGSTFEWGAPQTLFQTMFRGGTYASYAVARDGQRFLMNVPPSLEDITPITVVVNWMAAIQQ
jgi:Tol biopolymer transport system component